MDPVCGIQSGHEFLRPSDLPANGFEGRRVQNRRSPAFSGQRQLGTPRRFDDQGTRRDHRGQFRVAELLQQPENVAVDGLFPDVTPVAEIPAHQGGVDSGVQGGRIECEATSLAITGNTDTGVAAFGVLCEPVHQGQKLLDLVTQQMPAQFEGGPVDELPMRQEGPPDPRFSCSRLMRAGNHDPAAALGQAARELGCGRDPGNQAGDLFRALVRVRDGDDVGGGPALPGNQEQPFSMHLTDGGPADGQHIVGISPPDAGALPDRGHQFRTRIGHPRIPNSQDVSQPLPVRLQGSGVVPGG